MRWQLQPGGFGEPALEAFEPGLVAQAQVLVADALAACQHRVHELLGRQRVGIALADGFEPFHRVPGGVLQAQHVDAAQCLVALQHLGDVRRLVSELLELSGQLDGVFDRQLGARANGEVRGVHRITHQHHMGATVEVRPLLAADALEVQPGRAAQVARIGHQLVAAQVVGKQLFAEGHRFLGVELVQPMRLPHRFRRLDDEGGGLVVELVDMRLEPAVLGLHEREVEGVVELGRAQPDEAVGPRHHVGLEDVRVLVADLRVDAVAGDHQVCVGEVGVGVDLGVELQLHAEFLAARLQDVEQLLAPDADEAMAAAADVAALELELDVVPVVEGLLDGRGGGRVPLPHVVHGGVGEDHAPAEGVVGLVALDHGDVVARIELLHQQPEVQPGGAAPDADDLHAPRASAVLNRTVVWRSIL